MKKALQIFAVVVMVAGFMAGSPSQAQAYTPSLSAYSQGYGSVQVTVSSADRYARVDLYYRSQGTSLWTTITNIGSTDYSGYFSQNVNIGSTSTQSLEMYVMVNGQQSSTVTVNGTGCNYSNCNNGSISFSPSSLNLNVGQSQNVTIYNSVYAMPYNGGYYNNYYVSSNSNSSAVSASISGTTLYVNGNNAGSASITVCAYNSGNSCGTLYVTVSGNGNCGYYNCVNQITFSPSSPSLYVGQSMNVSVYSSGGYSLYVSSNSNSSVVDANLNSGNNTLSLYGKQNGSATITVCNSGYAGGCGSLYVTVSGNNNSQISLSQSNLSLNYGQSSFVTIYGYNTGSYYLSSNSNSSVASASVSGNTLAVTANSAGSTTLTVCGSGYNYYNSQCATLYVTVNGNNCGYYGCTNGQISLSQTSVTLRYGQTVGVTIYGNNSGSYYLSSNTNSGVATASVYGNTLSVLGNSTGSTTMTICGSGYNYYNNQCATLYVTVTGGSVLGGSTYSNGTLINDRGTIYIMYRNMKTGFANYAAFRGLGFNVNNAVSADASSLSWSGYTVTTANAQHPWGSWVKWGSTVYFVHESGLIPISSYDIFINNGGNPSAVVAANSYDTALPMLPLMTLNDYRLQ